MGSLWGFGIRQLGARQTPSLTRHALDAQGLVALLLGLRLGWCIESAVHAAVFFRSSV